MALPQLTVEVAFDSDPLAVTPVWTDISDRVRSVDVTTGKQSELDAYQPGQATLVLDNRDRRFDPTHTTGPYYAAGATKVLPRKKVRIRETLIGVTYDVYTGFLDGVPQRPGGLSVSDITVTCTDLFGILANIELPSSVYAIEVAADAPHAWWRLNEDRGDAMQDSSGNNHDGTYTDGSTRLSGEHPNQWETVPAIEWDNAHHAKVVDQQAAVLTRPCVVELLLNPVLQALSQDVQFVWGDGAGRGGHMLATYSSGAMTWNFSGKMVDGISNGLNTTSSGNLALGIPRHIVYRRPAAGAAEVYVDGVESGQMNFDQGLGFAFSGTQIASILPTGGAFEGAMADVAVYDADLTPARIAAHAAAFLAPWDGDTTGERAARIAVILGLDPTQYDIDTGKSYLGPAILGGNALEHFRTLEATEQGQFYVDHANAGKLRFADRHQRLLSARSTTVQATFTDEDESGILLDENGVPLLDESGVPLLDESGPALHWEAGSIELLWDWDFVYNEVTVAWSGGVDVTVSDADSIAAYGRRNHSVTTHVRTAAEARNLGEWILNRYKEPSVRIRSLEMKLSADDSTAVAALTLRENDLVQVKIRPQNTGARITFDLHVEGKQHHLDKATGECTTTLYLSPADPETGSYAIWGTALWGTHVWGY